MKNWCDYDFTLGMPHLAPNGLSEVELLKWLGVYQWESIARALGKPSTEIMNAQKERLYGSFTSIDLAFPDRRGIDAFQEGTKVSLYNRVACYARRFMEGMFAFDTEPISEAKLESISTP